MLKLRVRGFTNAEMMACLLVLGVTLAIIIPTALSLRDTDARHQVELQASRDTIVKAFEAYKVQEGHISRTTRPADIFEMRLNRTVGRTAPDTSSVSPGCQSTFTPTSPPRIYELPDKQTAYVSEQWTEDALTRRDYASVCVSDGPNGSHHLSFQIPRDGQMLTALSTPGGTSSGLLASNSSSLSSLNDSNLGSVSNAGDSGTVPVTCPAGQHVDTSGTCVCDDSSQSLVNGICTNAPNPCPTGQSRDASGQCVCTDSSQTLVNGVCTNSQPPCPTGQSRDASGQCQCDDSSLTLINGSCVTPPLPCPAGQSRDTNGQCVCDNVGEVLVNGQCQASGQTIQVKFEFYNAGDDDRLDFIKTPVPLTLSCRNGEQLVQALDAQSTTVKVDDGCVVSLTNGTFAPGFPSAENIRYELRNAPNTPVDLASSSQTIPVKVRAFYAYTLHFGWDGPLDQDVTLKINGTADGKSHSLPSFGKPYNEEVHWFEHGGLLVEASGQNVKTSPQGFYMSHRLSPNGKQDMWFIMEPRNYAYTSYSVQREAGFLQRANVEQVQNFINTMSSQELAISTLSTGIRQLISAVVSSNGRVVGTGSFLDIVATPPLVVGPFAHMNHSLVTGVDHAYVVTNQTALDVSAYDPAVIVGTNPNAACANWDYSPPSVIRNCEMLTTKELATTNPNGKSIVRVRYIDTEANAFIHPTINFFQNPSSHIKTMKYGRVVDGWFVEPGGRIYKQKTGSGENFGWI